MGLVHKIFGTHSQHELKRIAPIADKVESYREEYGKLTDEQLKAKTKEFKERLAKGETLDDILPEAYATVREAGKRVLDGALQSADYWWYYSSSGTYRRDAYR